MLNTVDFLRSVANEMLCAAAQGAAYPKSWGTEFRCKEIDRVWSDLNAPLRQQRGRKITLADIRSIADQDLFSLGFRNWDERLVVIPLWAWNYIADGETLTAIDGETVVKGAQKIDLDCRAGCIAYGFMREEY